MHENVMQNDTKLNTNHVRMKMFDRQERTIKDVRHVPNLRKNLLSLKALEARRCKFSDTDRGIKVTKGSMIVFKAERTRNCTR